MKRSGYTLIELVIAIGMVAVIIGAVVGIQLAVRESTDFSLTTLITVDQANGVLQEMARTVRNARSGDNGTFMLEVVNDQELAFYGNVDSDAATERVRYFLEGTMLKRGVIEPTSFPVEYPADQEKIKVLTETVQNGGNPLFYYYDGNNNLLAQLGRLNETTFIRIVVTANSNPDRPEGNYQLESFAQIRNLKTNL